MSSQAFCVFLKSLIIRQPSMDKITLAVDHHRAGITALKRIADCCLKEADTWASSVTALHKARQEEEKAAQRVKEQEKKQEERRIAREKNKQARDQKREKTKEAKAAAAALAADKSVEDGAGATKAKKRRRTGGQEDLSEQDPKILHEMSTFAGGSMGVVESFDEFIKLIVNAPGSACCLRLKKASFKKAMTALRWYLVG